MKEKSYELLLELGYQEKEIENILITYPLTNLKDETLYKNIKNIQIYIDFILNI